eukprot:5564403-Amphidinium_carterae.1
MPNQLSELNAQLSVSCTGNKQIEFGEPTSTIPVTNHGMSTNNAQMHSRLFAGFETQRCTLRVWLASDTTCPMRSAQRLSPQKQRGDASHLHRTTHCNTPM